MENEMKTQKEILDELSQLLHTKLEIIFKDAYAYAYPATARKWARKYYKTHSFNSQSAEAAEKSIRDMKITNTKDYRTDPVYRKFFLNVENLKDCIDAARQLSYMKTSERDFYCIGEDHVRSLCVLKTNSFLGLQEEK